MKYHLKALTLYSMLCCIFLLQLPLHSLAQVLGPRYRDSVVHSYSGNGTACGYDMVMAQQRKDPAFVAREKIVNQAILIRTLSHAAARDNDS